MINFLKRKFSEYYRTAKLLYPINIESREFGFMFYNIDTMYRHISFTKPEALRTYLITYTPKNVYYSTAFYNKPAAKTMADKLWLKAEFIFDLDFDHLPNTQNLTYEQKLTLVKKETLKLIENIKLIFGIDEKFISVNFSGSRGYHVHIFEPKVMSLNAYARKEIVSFLTYEGISSAKDIFQVQSIGIRKKQVKYVPMKNTTLKIKLFEKLPNFVKELANMDNIERMQFYNNANITKKIGTMINDTLFRRKGYEKILSGEYDIFENDKILDKFIELGINNIKIKMTNKLDAPVTADIKRLIRLPNSLHGSTGLIAKTISLGDLEKFVPLRDAIAFSEKPMKVNIVKDYEITMKNIRYKLVPGYETLPEYVSIFLLTQGYATLQ